VADGEPTDVFIGTREGVNGLRCHACKLWHGSRRACGNTKA
jgi:hypothetical protein